MPSKRFAAPGVKLSQIRRVAAPGALIQVTIVTAIGTLVERTTRFTMLLRLPPMDGHGI